MKNKLRKYWRKKNDCNELVFSDQIKPYNTKQYGKREKKRQRKRKHRENNQPKSMKWNKIEQKMFFFRNQYEINNKKEKEKKNTKIANHHHHYVFFGTWKDISHTILIQSFKRDSEEKKTSFSFLFNHPFIHSCRTL